MWLLNNSVLAVAVQQHLHPELREWLPRIEAAARRAARRGHDIPNRMLQVDRAAIEWVESHRVPCTSAYTVPYLSPAFCDQLLQELSLIDERGPGHERNKQEARAYQIPEFTTQDHCPQLYRTLRELHAGSLAAVWTLVAGRACDYYRSIQFAKYNPRGTAHGNWHVDEDSDQTTVVSLNPAQFLGGGTQLRTGPLTYVDVPVLPQGHALLFGGKTTLHRGLNVIEGSRQILVHWCEHKPQ